MFVGTKFYFLIFLLTELFIFYEMNYNFASIINYVFKYDDILKLNKIEK